MSRNTVHKVATKDTTESSKKRKVAIDEAERKARIPKLERRNPKAVPMTREAYREIMDTAKGQGNDQRFLDEAAKEALVNAAFAGAGRIIAEPIKKNVMKAISKSLDWDPKFVTGKGGNTTAINAAKRVAGKTSVSVKLPLAPVERHERMYGGTMYLARQTDVSELYKMMENGYIESPSIGIIPHQYNIDNAIPNNGFARVRSNELHYEGAPVHVYFKRGAFKPGTTDITATMDSWSPTSSQVAKDLSEGKTYADILKKWVETKKGQGNPVSQYIGFDPKGNPFIKTREQVVSEMQAKADTMLKEFNIKIPTNVTPELANEKFYKGFSELIGKFGELKPLRKVPVDAIDYVEIPRGIDGWTEYPKAKRFDLQRELERHGIKYRTYDRYVTHPDAKYRGFRQSGGDYSHPNRMSPELFREDSKGGDAGTRAAQKAGDTDYTAHEESMEEEVPNKTASEEMVPDSDTEISAGGPRIAVNPAVFKDKRDALCVALNESYRVIMELNGFEPQAEPTPAQRRFFADTAYANDELQLRRTILARICTFDTSVQ